MLSELLLISVLAQTVSLRRMGLSSKAPVNTEAGYSLPDPISLRKILTGAKSQHVFFFSFDTESGYKMM